MIIRRSTLVVAAALAIPAGIWLALSLADASRAAAIPGGEAVRRANRTAGGWLLDRSSPLPDCPPEGAAGTGREAVEGVYRWTDERGVEHFADEEERVPERYRAGSRSGARPARR